MFRGAAALDCGASCAAFSTRFGLISLPPRNFFPRTRALLNHHAMSPVRSLLVVALGFSLTVHAQQKKEDAPRTEADILKTVKLPEGYEATVFALPPQGGYPTACAAAIDGTLFVAIDENGSLGRDRNTPERPRGKVVRMRDTDGDGKADEFKTFATMESPRGVIWDGPSGTAPGTLYVMYPPKLTAFTDTDGDGVADKQEDIVTGLGFDLGFRGADHTTNGCRMGIDGFIYIAVGDYGYVEAKAKDGTVIKNRGGGIVRVRPDGTGLEIVSCGQRNIYDVAVSPTLDLFTRDNTNDGGGWNVRLSFVPPGAHMGYPTLFVNFPEDHVQPLNDYGGGSPCGALWLDEPGLPSGLFTVEWGRSAIMRHTMKPKGAGYELEGPGPGQEEWIKLVRPTDMDVDASGRLYITSWEGATFNYNGPNAGYVLRVVKKDKPKVEVPDLGKADDAKLAEMLGSPSATLRLAAQRELLRHGGLGLTTKINVAEKIDGNSGAARAYAIAFTRLETLRLKGKGPQSFSMNLDSNRSAIDDQAEVTAIGDHPELFKDAPLPALRSGLASKNPRDRAATITALRRLGKADAAPNILLLVADEDPIISHLAVRALSELKAVEPCLAALDSSDEKPKPGALRALYGIYEPAVVDGLIARLPKAQGELRQGILNALCRLDNQDAPYLNPSEWWTTRPDTSGPVYKPVKWDESEKIETALKRESEAAKGEDARWLIQRMYLCKVNMPGLVEQMLAACGNDTPARLKAIEGLFRSDSSLPPEGVKALGEVASNDAETPDLRGRALRLLQKGAGNGSVFPAAVAAFAPLAGRDLGQAALTSAFEDFTRDSKNSKWIGDYEKLAAGNDAAKRTFAQTVLVNLATSALVKGKDKEAAEKAVEKNWAKPETAASLLGVIARTKAKAYATKVDERLKDPNNAVAEAALFAHQALGLGGATQKQIAQLKYEEVFAAVQKGGDPVQGKDMFLRAGCIACHTIDANEPPKGPVLSAVAKIYDRAALTESILKPNAKLAQGFESTWVKTKKGEQLEGFVTRDGGDSIDLRNVAGQTVTVEKADIAERGNREQSMMPEGLLNAFTPAELANLLAWLESLKK
jgi:putative heme-binding domain-containing protein